MAMIIIHYKIKNFWIIQQPKKPTAGQQIPVQDGNTAKWPQKVNRVPQKLNGEDGGDDDDDGVHGAENRRLNSQQLRSQLDQLQQESDRTRSKANNARLWLVRLSEAAEKLRRQAALYARMGNETGARELLFQKKEDNSNYGEIKRSYPTAR
ncbi:hypothetical protein AKJ16_DCAP11147 [Drosera capensis]